MVRPAVGRRSLFGSWAFCGRLSEAGGKGAGPCGGALGVGTGMLCPERSGSMDKLECQSAGGAVEADRPESAVSDPRGERPMAQSGLAGDGSCAAGLARAMEGAVRLSAALGRELYRPGGLFGDLLQSEQLGGRGLQRRVQSPSGRLLYCERSSQAAVVARTRWSGAPAPAGGGTTRRLSGWADRAPEWRLAAFPAAHALAVGGVAAGARSAGQEHPLPGRACAGDRWPWRSLAGRREIAEIARFATILSQKQRHLLGLPRKKTTKAFYQVPTYSVFYALLTRLDPEAFASHVHGWLQAHGDALPQALAMDGKLIRDQIRTAHPRPARGRRPPVPSPSAIQKEGTPRCEQRSPPRVLESLPALDNKTITADALHCLRPNARAIAQKRR